MIPEAQFLLIKKIGRKDCVIRRNLRILQVEELLREVAMTTSDFSTRSKAFDLFHIWLEEK